MSGVYGILLILIGPIALRKLSSIGKNQTKGNGAGGGGIRFSPLPDRSSPTSILFHLLIFLHSSLQLYRFTSELLFPTDDIFKSKALNLSIHQSTSSIRSTLLSSVSQGETPEPLHPLHQLGLPSNNRDVQSLLFFLERLARFEGRIIYLLVGSDPILNCVYCVKRDDFILYHLFNNLLIKYLSTLLLIGFISIGFKQRQNLDALFTFVGINLAKKVDDPQPQLTFKKDSKNWRSLATCSIIAGFLFEASILLYQAHIDPNAGWWNHYNHNLTLLRNLHFLLLPILVLVFPTQRSMPIHQRAMLKLDLVEKELGQGVLHARAGRVGRELEQKRERERRELQAETKPNGEEKAKAKAHNGQKVGDGESEAGEKGETDFKVTSDSIATSIPNLENPSQEQSLNSQKSSGKQIDSHDSTSPLIQSQTQAQSQPQAQPEAQSLTPSSSSSSSSSSKAASNQSRNLSLEQLLSKALEAKVPPQSIENLRKQCDEVARNAWEVSHSN